MAPLVTHVITEPEEHEKLDAGDVYRHYVKMDIADAGTHELLIRTGAKEAHVTFGADANGDAQITISQDPTLTADGTEQLAGNFHFGEPDDNVTQLFDSPTITDIGTYKANVWAFGGSGSNPAVSTHAAAGIGGTYVIMEPNTDYIIQYINAAGRLLLATFEMDFYEKALPPA